MKVRIPKDAGGPSLSSLNKLKRMQEDMEQKQNELAEQEYKVSSGGGAVTVTATGTHRLVSVEIDPAVVDADDVETLQDLICAAVNEAMEQVDKTSEEELGKITGDLSGFGFPGGLV